MAVLVSSLAHESGHALVLRIFGADIIQFRVGALGAVIETDLSRLSYRQEVVAVLAGPAANLLLVLLLPEGAELLIGANFVLGIFNLLPLPLLDGGRAVRIVLSWLLGPERGDWMSDIVGRTFALILGTGLLGLMVFTGGSLWLLPACGAAFRMVMQREQKR